MTRFADLAQAARWHRDWLRDAALPLWSTVGADRARGGFHESLTVDGVPAPARRRSRVQSRQVWAFRRAGALGWAGPWRKAAEHGMSFLIDAYGRGPEFAATVNLDGTPCDDTIFLYEQAFVLLAMAALAGEGDYSTRGEALRLTLAGRRHAGGFREAGDQPFQANAQMHLLEAALAWEAVGVAGWGGVADGIVSLALSRFIDAERGFLREFFDDAWRPAPGGDGRLVEPGHQFEWAWLLETWGRLRERQDARAAARRLYRAGLAGIDSRRRVAINALWDDLSVRDGAARLWPQTEWLKAALILEDEPQAIAAAEALAAYYETPVRGAWRDKMLVDGGFVSEPAPASSFYHIVCATSELLRAQGLDLS